MQPCWEASYHLNFTDVETESQRSCWLRTELSDAQAQAVFRAQGCHFQGGMQFLVLYEFSMGRRGGWWEGEAIGPKGRLLLGQKSFLSRNLHVQG